MLSTMFSRRNFIRASAFSVVATAAHVQATNVKPEKIRIGQIGTAHAHASGKMDTMRASEDFQVVGIVEPDPTRRAQAEQNKSYAGLPWMTEEQLLNVPGLQAV